MITLQCPNCGKILHVGEEYLGQRGKCNHCQGEITVEVAPIKFSAEAIQAASEIEVAQQSTTLPPAISQSDVPPSNIHVQQLRPSKWVLFKIVLGQFFQLPTQAQESIFKTGCVISVVSVLVIIYSCDRLVATKPRPTQNVQASAPRPQLSAVDIEKGRKQREDSLRQAITKHDPNGILITGVSVTSVGSSIWNAKETVHNSWHVLDYQTRLQAAQNLWTMWAQIASPSDLDSAHISFVDSNGNEVGGSRWPAGSLIWVQDR